MTLRVLVSYHYHRQTDLAAFADQLGGDVDFFADSGAYSAATTGATIHLPDYAAWLRHWAPLLTVQSTLDVIGDHEATARNTDALLAHGCDPLPAFHVGEPWPVLEGLCARYRYVALGGMALHAAGSAKYRPLMAWLVKAFRIAAEHGTVFHGFGMTSSRIVTKLPFYSADSSSYTQCVRFGLAYLWDPRHLKIRDAFFRNSDDVRRYAHLLTRHGLDPGRVLDPAFMRPTAPTHADDRRHITAASARAYLLMEQSLAARHRVPAPPLPLAADTGTKIYLAVAGAGTDEITPLRLARQGTA